jgi:hypothetical protein
MIYKKLAALIAAAVMGASLMSAPAQARFGGFGGMRGGGFCGARWRLRRHSWRICWAPRLCRTVGLQRSTGVLPRTPVCVLSTSPVRRPVLRRRSTLCRLFVVLDLGAVGLRLATSLGV